MKLRYVILLVLVAVSVYAVYIARQQPYDNPVDLKHIPTFSPVELNFEHQHAGESLPFAGAAVIDIDDGAPELFLGGGRLQRDGLFTFRDGRFENISGERGLGKDIGDATYAAASIDVNRDGRVDLFVARDSGLYLYYNRDGFFVQRKVAVEFAEHEVPVGIALGDINRDDRIDLFVSCFSRPAQLGRLVLTAEGNRGSSKLLVNQGDNRFREITESAGLSRPGNSFSAVFAELNNDDWIDLVVTYQQASPVVYENIGGERFKAQPPVGAAEAYIATGAAVGDINDDGLTDLLFTASGTSVPGFLLAGEGGGKVNTQWALLRNNGGFEFDDIGAEAKIAGYELAWGAVFADFNLDGRQDIAAAQNLVGWPPQWLYKNPGRLLIQKDDGSFSPVETTAGAENRRYGVNPITADFNDDGYPELVWVNIGGPARALINNGGNARYVKLNLGDNPAALGARIRLRTNDGRTFNSQYTAETGLGTDHTPLRIFGIGPQAGIESLDIEYLSGKTLTLDKPPLNQTLDFRPTPAPAPAAPPPVATDRETPQPAEPQPAGEPDEPEPVAPSDEPEPETTIEDELESLLDR